MIIITSVIYRIHYIKYKNSFNTIKTQLKHKFNKFITKLAKINKKTMGVINTNSTQIQHEFNTNNGDI